MARKTNKSTAAQRAYISKLASGCTQQEWETFYAGAARLNQNLPTDSSETPTQAANRLTKTAASSLIDAMLQAGVKPAAQPKPREAFLEVKEPALLAPVDRTPEPDHVI